MSRQHADSAEVAVELEPSGHWFGGAHLIRQLWPLNHAAIEMGPWYGFDNGELHRGQAQCSARLRLL